MFNYIKKTERLNGHGHVIGYDTDVKVAKMIGHAALSIFTLSIILNSWTTVPAGQVKVQTLFGDINPTILDPGFHVVNPMANFTTYSGLNRTYNIENIMVPSQDKLKTDMDISVIYSFDTVMSTTIKDTFGTLEELESKLLVPTVRSLVREVGKGVENSQDFFLDDVQTKMQSDVRERLVVAMEPKGIYIQEILFRDISLPKVVADAIVQTKQRQEQINQERAQLDIIEQKAKQQIVKAQAKEVAAVSQANAKRTQADAEAYRLLEIAKAVAGGNKLVSKTLTKDLIEANRIDKWDGKYPTTMMSGGNGVLLNVPIK